MAVPCFIASGGDSLAVFASGSGSGGSSLQCGHSWQGAAPFGHGHFLSSVAHCLPYHRCDDNLKPSSAMRHATAALSVSELTMPMVMGRLLTTGWPDSTSGTILSLQLGAKCLWKRGLVFPMAMWRGRLPELMYPQPLGTAGALPSLPLDSMSHVACHCSATLRF